MSKKTNNKHQTIAIQTSLTDISSLKKQTHKKWQAQLINATEKLLTKLTKMPVSISTQKEDIMLNACAIFWYNDNDTKKFVMLKSVDKSNDEVVSQFPFVACMNKESISSTLEIAAKDLFGKAFVKTLPFDVFASDNVSSAPTVVVTDENDEVQSILHNLVWTHQITPKQVEMLENHSDQFSIVTVPEYNLTAENIHEVHKFLYQSCIRHIHKNNFDKIVLANSDGMDDFLSKDNSESGRTLH